MNQTKRSEPIRHRLCHGKTGLSRFVSHIDLIHYFSRLMARARVPLAFTEGFNPKPKFEFGPALSTGIESCCEYVDFFLDAPGDTAALLPVLQRAGIPDLAITTVEVAPPGKLSRALLASEFLVTVTEPASSSALPSVSSDLSAFLALASVAALEQDGIAAAGFVERVEVVSQGEAGAELCFVTRHIDGRALSPRLLEKLPGAEHLSFRHMKKKVRFAP